MAMALRLRAHGHFSTPIGAHGQTKMFSVAPLNIIVAPALLCTCVTNPMHKYVCHVNDV